MVYYDDEESHISKNLRLAAAKDEFKVKKLPKKERVYESYF